MFAPAQDSNYVEKEIYRFLDWSKSRIKKEIKKLKQDIDGHNNYLKKNLSYNKRFGRINREDFRKSQKKLSPFIKYRDMADGRDGGLCSIERNSE